MLEFLKIDLNDAEELIKVKKSAFAEDVNTYGFGPTGYDDLESLIGAIGKYPIYKMVLDGTIVGGMTCCNQGNGEYWIGGIYIDKEHQNMGLGAKAIKFLEEEFPDAKIWRLDTPYKNYRNHHFYEKLGYKKIGETEPRSDRNGFYLYLYEKRMPIITVCGDDCSVCPRYNAKTTEELEAVAKLWHKFGWRDSIVSPEEIKCNGCGTRNKCRYGILACTIENSVAGCKECEKYPCSKIDEMLKQSDIMEQQCKSCISEEEFKIYKRAFYEKKKNIERK